MKKLFSNSLLLIAALFVGNYAFAGGDPCPPVMAGESGTIGECRSYTVFETQFKWCDTGAEGSGDCVISE